MTNIKGVTKVSRQCIME